MGTGACYKCGAKDRENKELEHYQIAGANLLLCMECAIAEGFCIICGEFFGGTEEFLRSGIKGCCVDCKAMFDDEVSYPVDTLWDDID